MELHRKGNGFKLHYSFHLKKEAILVYLKLQTEEPGTCRGDYNSSGWIMVTYDAQTIYFNEIWPHTCYNGYYQKEEIEQTLTGMWRKVNDCALLGKIQIIQMLWKTVWRFLKKLKRDLPYNSAIVLLGIYSKTTILTLLKCN